MICIRIFLKIVGAVFEKKKTKNLKQKIQFRLFFSACEARQNGKREANKFSFWTEIFMDPERAAGS